MATNLNNALRKRMQLESEKKEITHIATKTEPELQINLDETLPIKEFDHNPSLMIYREVAKDLINDQDVPDNLDALTNQLLELKEQVQNSMWLMGQRLLKIKNEHLYSPNYAIFEDYLKDKLDFSRRTAYGFMQICQSFSYVQALAHGSKLNLILRIRDPQKRLELIEIVERDKPSFRELEIKVKQIAAETKIIDIHAEHDTDIASAGENKSLQHLILKMFPLPDNTGILIKYPNQGNSKDMVKVDQLMVNIQSILNSAGFTIEIG